MANTANNINTLLDKVVCGENLTTSEAEKLFTDIFLHDTEGYHLAALTGAIHSKGETTNELLGFCKSSAKLSIKLNPKVNNDLLTDLTGTGGGKIKTINVSTAASFIVSALGYVVAKQAGYAQTSPTGSGDIFRAFGIDVFQLSKTQVEKTLETIGICPYYLSAMSPKMKNRSQVAKKIFVDKRLQIHSPFHIAAFAYSATKLKKRIYGCYDQRYLDTLGHLFTKLGLDRTIVLHGVGGIPEASNFGQTLVVEQNGNNLKKYSLSPTDFGIKKSRVQDIASGGREQNIIDFLKVISGKASPPKQDLVLINTSISLYSLGKVTNLKQGVQLARQAIKNKQAYNKLEALVTALGNMKMLQEWKVKANLP